MDHLGLVSAFMVSRGFCFWTFTANYTFNYNLTQGKGPGEWCPELCRDRPPLNLDKIPVLRRNSRSWLLGIALGVLEGLINRGFFRFSIVTPFSGQCYVFNSHILLSNTFFGCTVCDEIKPETCKKPAWRTVRPSQGTAELEDSEAEHGF